MSYDLYFLAFCVGYIIYKLGLKSFLVTNLYKKQKLFTEFIFPFGNFKRMKQNLLDKRDIIYTSKSLAKQDPKMNFHTVNAIDNVIVAVCDPEMLTDFFKKISVYKRYDYETKFLRMLVGENVMTASSHAWQKYKQAMLQYFHFSNLADKLKDIKSITKEVCEKINSVGLKNVDILFMFQLITGEVINRLFFSENMMGKILKSSNRPLSVEIAEVYDELGKQYKNPLCWIFGVKFIKLGLTSRHRYLKRRINEIRKIVTQMVAERKVKSHKPKDLLTVLLETQHNADKKVRLTDVDIVNAYLGLMSAGVGTTALTLTAALYNLLKSPEEIKIIQEEVKEVYQDKVIKMEVLGELGYMTCIINETLRLNSPCPSTLKYEATHPHKLGETIIEEGNVVYPDIAFNNFREDNFPEPEKFRPQRWLEEKIRDVKFIPFSSGYRGCLGQHLAFMEMKIILSEFISRYNFKLSNSDYNPIWDSGVYYQPVPSLTLDLEKRN